MFIDLRKSVMHRTSRDNKTILISTPKIYVGPNIQTSHGLIIRDRNIKFWGNPQEFLQQQENMSSLEGLLAKYITKNEAAIQNQQAAIKNLETLVG